jgi:ABC-type transporter Mla subunit MlaD
MTNALTFRALGALPPALQQLARQHIEHHPYDDINDLIGELSLALLELADAAPDATRVFSRARSRLRRATQDVAHYAASIDDARHDTAQDDEPTPARRKDIVREVARQQHVSLRRAQQLVRRQIERAQIIGDLFAGVVCQ